MTSSYAKGYSTSNSLVSTGNAVWMIVSIVIAVIGAIVLYFTFLSKKNEGKFTGFLGWMYDFLSFKKMVIENILKIIYLMVAMFITLSSFALISTSFLSFLCYLVIGNIVTRVIYELFLVTLIICKNTTEINKKMSAKNDDDASKQ